MQYVAAFRTYTWDDDVRELANRFFKSCPHGRHVVLADETSGPLGITEYEVISHTDDTSDIGLPNYPEGKSLWYNVDYGLYYLRRALPDFQYYLTSESDLAVNTGLERLVSAAIDRQIDLMTHTYLESTPDWYWHLNATSFSDYPMRTLLFFTLFSSRALDLMFAERLKHAKLFMVGSLKDWPFCEPFVPTILNNAKMRISEIKEFVDTTRLSFRPTYEIRDPLANMPGTLVHSVLGREKFIHRLISEYGDDIPELFRRLKKYDITEYVDFLRSHFLKNRNHAGYQLVLEFMRANGVAVPHVLDVAQCKPSLVSSVYRWSKMTDPIKEAAGANGVTMYDDYGFHTSDEYGPWWLVDLLSPCQINEIKIVNRESYCTRFVNFMVESSFDSSTWTVRHVKLTLDHVSFDPTSPHKINFTEPFICRFIKIKLIGQGVLHLRSVQVHGHLVDRSD